MIIWWQLLLVILISYACGNISFARIISRSKNQDITKMGSGNPGSTNVLRQFGFKFGIINLALDMLKAFIPALACFYIFGHSYLMLYIAGVSSMLGHVYPVVYKFKGGKGIATMMGIFLAANPIATAIMLVIGFVIWAIFEYGAVVSLLCVTVLTVVEGIRLRLILPSNELKIVCLILFAIFLLTWYSHRKNISRLLLGKENKASLIKKTKKKIKSKLY